jgi:tetratricopeptide (TPR) repeat protein
VKNACNFLLLAVLFTAQPSWPQVLPDVPDGAQAVALSGEALYVPEPGQGALERLATAKADYAEHPDDADKLVWYGRRTAYTGDYRGAIEIFSEGMDKFPEDARMFRHRGHRYISIREFDRAIADLERATQLIEGTDNEIEPDGLPNALNIPISSLHGNIWYHLGLAYYLKQDWDNAYRAYKTGFDAARNDDNRVSTTHWMYMILRRKGDSEAAEKVLDVIKTDMNVIENTAYYDLCLFYKGELTLAELIGEDTDSSPNSAVMYGAANWLYYTGDVEKAEEMLRGIIATNNWAPFGYVAAEADLAIDK